MITRGNDQSTAIRCGKHGRNAGGVFFRPEPNEGAVADYLCMHCWIEAGRPEKLTAEDFSRLKWEHLPAVLSRFQGN